MKCMIVGDGLSWIKLQKMVPDFKEKKSVRLVQPSLSLRPLLRSDCFNVCQWLTSSYILQYSFVVSGKKSLPKDFSTAEYGLRYFNMILSDPKRVTFAMMCNGQHVGNVGLKGIDKATSNAECFIEIGESKYRSKGLGTLAMIKVLDFAYFTYDLDEILLDVLEFNLKAIRVYHRLGFITIGFNGWHYDEYGQYWRVLRMSLLKARWALSPAANNHL